MTINNFFLGTETGVSSTKVIVGDISKPVSVYAENASDWWKIWEYKVGIQVNTDDGGFNISTSILETAATVSSDGNSLQTIVGLNKIGVTVESHVDFSNRTAGFYSHSYIRTIPAGALALATYYSGGAIFVPIPSYKIFS